MSAMSLREIPVRQALKHLARLSDDGYRSLGSSGATTIAPNVAFDRQTVGCVQQPEQVHPTSGLIKTNLVIRSPMRFATILIGLVFRRNSVRGRSARTSTRDAARQRSAWLGRQTIHRGDGTDRDLKGGGCRPADRECRVPAPCVGVRSCNGRSRI